MKRDKIKLKYLMGLWKQLPSYPTSEDIVYELTVYLAKDGRPNKEFTFQTLNSVFGKNWEHGPNYARVQEMIQNGEIIKTEKKDSGKEWYKIAFTPYY